MKASPPVSTKLHQPLKCVDAALMSCKEGERGGGCDQRVQTDCKVACTPVQALSAGRPGSFNDGSGKRSDELATTSAHEEVLPGLPAESSEVRSTFIRFFLHCHDGDIKDG